jgi:hypothetical protein
MMKFCENLDCEYGDEPLERVSDYRIIDGAVICIRCYKAEQEQAAEDQRELKWEEANWWAANAELAEVDTVSRILSGR